MRGKDKNSGIKIQNQISVASIQDTSKLMRYKLFQIVLVFVSTIAPIYSWLTALKLEINQGLFWVGTAITIALFFAIGELKKLRWIFLTTYLLLFALIGHYCFKYFVNGFYCLENAVLGYACPYFGVNPVRFMVFEDPYLSSTMLMLAFVQAIVFIAFLEIFYHYMRTVYLFLIIVFEGGLMIIGIAPPTFWMLVLVFLYVSMNTMDQIPSGVIQRNPSSKKRIREYSMVARQNVRIHAVIAMIIALLMILLTLRVVITPEKYGKNEKILERKEKLQESIRNFSYSGFMASLREEWNRLNPFYSGDFSISAGLDSGKIGRTGSISYNGDTALQVTVNEGVNYLYLKGFAGADYTGKEWTKLSEEDETEYEYIRKLCGEDAEAAETMLRKWCDTLQEQSISSDVNESPLQMFFNIGVTDVFVKYQNANDSYLYAPYIGNYRDVGDLTNVGDLYMKPAVKENCYLFRNNYVQYGESSNINYFYEVLPFIESRFRLKTSYKAGTHELFESLYRDFVKNVYTRLPDKGLERLKNISLNYTDGSNENRVEMINQVINYLRQNTTYSLSPGLPPQGEDVTEYFLFDAHKGFCSHYASAAVLILRNNHVPARYVEGYIVTREDIENGEHVDRTSIISVRDYNAHAWIEVYFDGIGWVPIEVTNGYSEAGITDNLSGLQNQSKATPTPTPTAIPTATPKPTQEATPTPTMEATPIPTPQLSPSPVTKPGTDPKNNEVKTKENRRISKITLWIFVPLFGTLALIGLFALFYLIRKRKLLQALTNGTSKHRIIRQYDEIARILNRMHIDHKRNETYEAFIKYAKEQCMILPKGFEEIVALALKAGFSNQKVNDQDVYVMYTYYSMLRENYYRSNSKIKRFLYKYWNVI